MPARPWQSRPIRTGLAKSSEVTVQVNPAAFTASGPSTIIALAVTHGRPVARICVMPNFAVPTPVQFVSVPLEAVFARVVAPALLGVTAAARATEAEPRWNRLVTSAAV